MQSNKRLLEENNRHTSIISAIGVCSENNVFLCYSVLVICVLNKWPTVPQVIKWLLRKEGPGSIPGKYSNYFHHYIQTGSVDHLNSNIRGTRGVSRRKIGRKMDVSDNLLLAWRLNMYQVSPPTTLPVFMSLRISARKTSIFSLFFG
jgi:hypothetical protein